MKNAHHNSLELKATSSDSSFAHINDKEKQQILTFKKLEQQVFDTFALKITLVINPFSK